MNLFARFHAAAQRHGYSGLAATEVARLAAIRYRRRRPAAAALRQPPTRYAALSLSSVLPSPATDPLAEHGPFLQAALANPHDEEPWWLWHDHLHQTGHVNLAQFLRHSLLQGRAMDEHETSAPHQRPITEQEINEAYPTDWSPFRPDLGAFGGLKMWLARQNGAPDEDPDHQAHHAEMDRIRQRLTQHREGMEALAAKLTPQERTLAGHAWQAHLGKLGHPGYAHDSVAGQTAWDLYSQAVRPGAGGRSAAPPAQHQAATFGTAEPGAPPRSPARSSRGMPSARYAAADVRQLAEDLLEGIGGSGWYKTLFYRAIKRTGSMAEALDLLHHVLREYPPGFFEAKAARKHAQGKPAARYAAPRASGQVASPVVPQAGVEAVQQAAPQPRGVFGGPPLHPGNDLDVPRAVRDLHDLRFKSALKVAMKHAAVHAPEHLAHLQDLDRVGLRDRKGQPQGFSDALITAMALKGIHHRREMGPTLAHLVDNLLSPKNARGQARQTIFADKNGVPKTHGASRIRTYIATALMGLANPKAYPGLNKASAQTLTGVERLGELASISTLPNSVNKRDVWGQEKRMARRLPPNQGIGVGSSASCEATRYGLCARLSSRTTTSSSNTSTVADTSSRLRNSFFAVAC